MTTLDQYQARTADQAIYPSAGEAGSPMSLAYLGLGLTGESGEVADKIKKVIRDDAGIFSEEKRQAILLELGDALWYLTRLADEFGCPMQTVLEMNLEKIDSRRLRGTQGGSGDDR